MAGNESMWRRKRWDQMAIRTVQLNPSDLVMAGEEKHATVALTCDFVLPQGHNMRTSAGAGVVVPKKAQVGAVPIVSTARVRHCGLWLDRWMNNPKTKRLADRPLNDLDI